ncbi:MAG: hypothetical protein M8357_10335 [Desulfobulbaceae bacterium]|nr:hypothetical protein [Desulfobulbaceae bacterium]
MHDTEKSERHHPRKKNPEPLKPVLILFALLLLAIAGAGIFFYSGSDDTGEPDGAESLVTGGEPPVAGESEPDPVTEGETAPDREQDATAVIQKELQTGEPFSAEPLIESPEDKRAKECRMLAGQIHGFFTTIDSKDYIKPFDLQEPSQQYFIALADKLLKNPPVVSRESDDLYTILKNMAHFFRVIGKDNIILIKTILDRERDKIEDVAAEFYQWTAWNSCNDDLLQFSPTLAEMYEYAGFFLNTMGGRSYLFRRDSRSRLLVNYYSVLLIERANQEGLNRHGIDISQVIPQLVQEIDSSNQLIYKENYIDSLYTLLEKYQ